MNWENQLISVYVTACDFFSQLDPRVFLKISPNSNHSFLDSEAITVYIFGVMEGFRNVKSIHHHFKKHLNEWFPDLPEYEGFIFRINCLNKVFVDFLTDVLSREEFVVDKNHPNY